MKRIYLIATLILAGCGNSSNTGGVTNADTQISDVQIDDSDVAGTDATGTDASLQDVQDVDGGTGCPGAPDFYCCQAGDPKSYPPVCGSWGNPKKWTCSNGFASTESCSWLFDIVDTGPDIPDTTDTGTCPNDQGGACCCAGDVAAQLTCFAGNWQCPAGYGKFYGDQCNGSKCGGPCSLPCPMDVMDGAGDTGASCVGKTPTGCCCSGFGGLAEQICSGGDWKCPEFYTKYDQPWCEPPTGPCSPTQDAGG